MSTSPMVQKLAEYKEKYFPQYQASALSPMNSTEDPVVVEEPLVSEEEQDAEEQEEIEEEGDESNGNS